MRSVGRVFLSSKLAVLAFFYSLIDFSAASYFDSKVPYSLYWETDPSKNANESFHITLDVVNLNDKNCSVANMGNLFKVARFTDGPNHHASWLVPVEQYLTGIPIVSNSAQMILMDYRFLKYIYTTAYEYAIYFNMTSNKSEIMYNEMSVEFPQYKNINLTDSDLHSNTLKLYLSKDTNMHFEVCNETSGSTAKIFFKIGYFNRTTPSSFRKIQIFEIPTSANNDHIKINFTQIQLIPLGYFGISSRQFLVYQAGTPDLFLINSYFGVEKNSSLVMERLKMPFNINRVIYIEGQFIVMEQTITVSNVEGKQMKISMNYYTIQNFATKLAVESLLNYRNLTRGRFMTSHSSSDRNFIMLDFLMPDLDGVEDETIVSTLYFSKQDQTFGIFVEEFTVNRNSSVQYQPHSYHRILTETHAIEFYKKIIDNKTYEDAYSMYIVHKKTGRSLGERKLELNGTTQQNISHIFYLKAENLILIKFETSESTLFNKSNSSANTLAMVVQDPYIIYHMINYNMSAPVKSEPSKSAPVSANRMLQLTNPNNTVVLEIHCTNNTSEDTSSKERVRAEIKFYLVEKNGDYFDAIKDPNMYPEKNETVRIAKDNLVKEIKISGTFANGVDISLETSQFSLGSFIEFNMTSKRNDGTIYSPNIRKETYKIRLPSLHLVMPVFYEVRVGKKTSRSIILDIQGRTSYFKPEGDKLVFEKQAIDTRNITDIEMINGTHSLINISSNVFALDVTSLKEKPLPGIGSFCINVANTRIPDANEFLLCMTDKGFQAQFTHEMFSATQTRINVREEDITELLKKETLYRMIYSRKLPSLVFVMTESNSRQTSKVYTLNIFELVRTMGLKLQKTLSFTLNEISVQFNNGEDELYFMEMMDDYLIMTTKKNLIFTYHVHMGYKEGQKYQVTFMRKFDINEFFQEHRYAGKNYTFNIKIDNYETIHMYDTSSTSSSSERQQINRVAFLIEIETKCAGEPSSITYNAITFNHHLSGYDAFDTIFRGDNCARLFFGPAFVSEGEKQEKLLDFVCIQGPIGKRLDPDKPYDATLMVLQFYDNKLHFNEDTQIDSIFDYKENSPTFTANRTFKITFYKSPFIMNVLSAPPSTDQNDPSNHIRLSREIHLNFSEPFQHFEAKTTSELNRTVKITLSTSLTLFDLLRKKEKTIIRRNISDFFDGHVFATEVKCESYIECRDKVINGTGQELFVGYVERFVEFKNMTRFKFGFINLTNGTEYTYLAGGRELITSFRGEKQVINLMGLALNCSEFKTFERFMITFCLYEMRHNYFRIIDLDKNFDWYDIKVTFPSGRLLNSREVELHIKENYMVLYTYNQFFKRYLTIFMFKLTNSINFENSTRGLFFHNPLFDKLGILYFGENPMNDESINFKIYRDEGQSWVLGFPNATASNLANSTDKIYVWALRRLNSSSYDLRIEGMKLTPSYNNLTGKFSYDIKVVSDDTKLLLRFKLQDEKAYSYLLDKAKIILMNVEDTSFYDIILHMPYSQDYMMRFNSSVVESGTIKRLNISTDIQVLTISNPFYGIRTSKDVRPVFFNSTYFVPGNYYPFNSTLRCYYIDMDTKKLAKPLTSNYLFNFTPSNKSTTILVEDSLNSIYTYALLRFDDYLETMYTQDMIIMEGDYFTNTTQFGRLR